MDIIVAFSAGLLSFLPPCVLPLIPIYLSHLVGTSVAEHQSHQASMKLLLKAGFLPDSRRFLCCLGFQSALSASC
ncbi:cytochrome c biogenesis protein CcdA [Paenibacillus lignilyticus]|uniref:Cytochrome C biogenesis protein transmembrane domain-containing protein n=1 Tax=Paenibacillus lignilyticus TaxID=1172615 RepID=A0ABS5CKT7_9BACL|nr:cytochrome c biogenesis protein CcdA [Paenibacillus lignilyticus]MBP3966482.1 hypothetical protein [Paenibacillus lignilyticus]